MLNIYYKFISLYYIGPLAARAAVYTAGVVGGLTLTAASAPSDKYLRWSGPLSLGLGVVFVASIGEFGLSRKTIFEIIFCHERIILSVANYIIIHLQLH